MGLFDNELKTYDVWVTVETEPRRVKTFKTRVHARNSMEIGKNLAAQYSNFKKLERWKEIKASPASLPGGSDADRDTSESKTDDDKAEKRESVIEFYNKHPKLLIAVCAVVISAFTYLIFSSGERLLITGPTYSYVSAQPGHLTGPAQIETKDSNQYWVQGKLILKKGKGEVRFDIKTASYSIAGSRKEIAGKGKVYEAYEISSYYHKDSDKIKGPRYLPVDKAIRKADTDAFEKFRHKYVSEFARQKGLNLNDYDVEFDD